MPLQRGTPLGPYEVVSALGAGGMGEVHRARDTRLGRDVAVKVLPAGLSADPDKRNALTFHLQETVCTEFHEYVVSGFSLTGYSRATLEGPAEAGHYVRRKYALDRGDEALNPGDHPSL